MMMPPKTRVSHPHDQQQVPNKISDNSTINWQFWRTYVLTAIFVAVLSLIAGYLWEVKAELEQWVAQLLQVAGRR